jgi:hypothetical protein
MSCFANFGALSRNDQLLLFRYYVYLLLIVYKCVLIVVQNVGEFVVT